MARTVCHPDEGRRSLGGAGGGGASKRPPLPMMVMLPPLLFPFRRLACLQSNTLYRRRKSELAAYCRRSAASRHRSCATGAHRGGMGGSKGSIDNATIQRQATPDPRGPGGKKGWGKVPAPWEADRPTHTRLLVPLAYWEELRGRLFPGSERQRKEEEEEEKEKERV